VRVVGALRALELRKSPSIAETIDWARTLLALGADHLDGEIVNTTLGVVLKYETDKRRAVAELKLDEVLG
jgi:hypothetical protein